MSDQNERLDRLLAALENAQPAQRAAPQPSVPADDRLDRLLSGVERVLGAVDRRGVEPVRNAVVPHHYAAPPISNKGPMGSGMPVSSWKNEITKNPMNMSKAAIAQMDMELGKAEG